MPFSVRRVSYDSNIYTGNGIIPVASAEKNISQNILLQQQKNTKKNARRVLVLDIVSKLKISKYATLDVSYRMNVCGMYVCCPTSLVVASPAHGVHAALILDESFELYRISNPNRLKFCCSSIPVIQYKAYAGLGN